MALTYCLNCQSLEGGTHYEIVVDPPEHPSPVEDEGIQYEVLVCNQCGSDEIDFIPEHDSSDYER